MPRIHYDIDPDIRRAHTIASEFYTDPEVFELSKEKIFSKSWQFFADSSAVRVPGQLYPFTLLEGLLDEPLLLSRDKNDALHCFSNVCTHRGNILVDHPCIENNIRCRYHGRRFTIDGKFQSMPEFEEVSDFPSEKDNLHTVKFREWKRFIFGNLNSEQSFDEVFGDMIKRIGKFPVEEFKPEPVMSREYRVKAHWVLYVENYLEGFHIPYIHSSLNSVIDYSTYKTELYPYSTLQLALAKGAEDYFDLPADSPDAGKKVAAYYYWIFPNLMFNFYPWGLSINIVRPIAPNLSRVSFMSYVYDGSRLDKGAGALLDKVEREDEEIVENVQKGIRSRYYDSGRYAPAREQGTHHFHRLIAEFMNA